MYGKRFCSFRLIYSSSLENQSNKSFEQLLMQLPWRHWQGTDESWPANLLLCGLDRASVKLCESLVLVHHAVLTVLRRHILLDDGRSDDCCRGCFVYLNSALVGFNSRYGVQHASCFAWYGSITACEHGMHA